MPEHASQTDVAAGGGLRVEHHARIGSTNDRARALLREPDGAAALVVADEQLAGRGRRGRSWASPPGRNLYLSLGVRPRLAAADAWQLAFATALAVRDACAPVTDLRVKWPNDLVAADGAKVAGLLIETSVDGEHLVDAVIGVGINVNWPRSEMPAELRASATSLAELAAVPIDRRALQERLARALVAEIARLETGERPLERYRAASWLTNRHVEVETGDETVPGVVRGIGETGALLLDTVSGTREVGHGEVARVRPQGGVAA